MDARSFRQARYHTLRVSGRSANLEIDQFVLFKGINATEVEKEL